MIPGSLRNGIHDVFEKKTHRHPHKTNVGEVDILMTSANISVISKKPYLMEK